MNDGRAGMKNKRRNVVCVGSGRGDVIVKFVRTISVLVSSCMVYKVCG